MSSDSRNPLSSPLSPRSTSGETISVTGETDTSILAEAKHFADRILIGIAEVIFDRIEMNTSRPHIPTAYIAGPMRGIPAFNYPLFNAVAARLRAHGWRIFNPAETDAQVAERAADAINPLRVYMERDLADVSASDAVFVLPGWKESEGANIEITVAFLLGIPVYELPKFNEVPVPSRALWASDPLMPTLEPQTLPVSSEARKGIPLTTGVLDYFPAALAEVAKVSKAGNDKHNPGEPMHWARGKSTDQADAVARHLLERGGIDPDTGLRHTAQLAWRALALLQIELEEAGEAPLARGASE